jgi:hypothetical protein
MRTCMIEYVDEINVNILTTTDPYRSKEAVCVLEHGYCSIRIHIYIYIFLLFMKKSRYS